MPKLRFASQDTLEDVKTTADDINARAMDIKIGVNDIGTSVGTPDDTASDTGRSLWSRIKAFIDSFKAFTSIWTHVKADRIDADISSRAAADDLAAANTNISAIKATADTIKTSTDTIKNASDTIKSTADTIKNNTESLNSSWPASKADLLDISVSSRAAAVDLSTLNTTANDIKAVTDIINVNFTATRAGYLDAAVSSRASANDLAEIMNELKAVHGKVDETFTSASNGKAAIAGSIGSPALSDNTFAQMSEHINTSKTTLAANLTAKGVIAAATQPLQALVKKVSEIKSTSGYSKIEEVAILSSGTYIIPAGVVKIDIALVGGGSGVASGVGNGGYVRRVYDLSVVGGQQYAVVIGAGGASGSANAGGATSFGSYSSSTGSTSPYQYLWGDSKSLMVGGRGSYAYGATNNVVDDSTALQVLAGSALVVAAYSSSGSGGVTVTTKINARNNLGGGGYYFSSSTPVASLPGSSGRVQLRLFYEAA